MGQIPPDVHTRFPITSAIAVNYSNIISGNWVWKRPKVGGDCRYYCTFEQVVAKDPVLKIVAIRSKSYMVGVPFRDVVIIKNQMSDEPLVYIHLNLSGSISSILIISRGYDFFRDSLFSYVEVYDRMWNRVGAERFELLSSVSQIVDQSLRILTITTPSPGGLVLCESVDFATLDKAGLLDSLRRRPSPIDASTMSGSLLGWLPNSVGSLGRFVDPVVELEDWIMKPYNTQEIVKKLKARDRGKKINITFREDIPKLAEL